MIEQNSIELRSNKNMPLWILASALKLLGGAGTENRSYDKNTSYHQHLFLYYLKRTNMFRIPPGTVPFVKQWYRSTEHIHRSRMGQAQPK
jgi:hypothetical protein